MTSCMPPPSSKKRSAMMVFCVGTSPSTARPATRCWMACSEPAASRPHSCCSHSMAAATSGALVESATGEVFPNRALSSSRSTATCSESSAVRAGASPSQNGIPGGAPCASSTSTRPEELSMRRMRHEVLPRMKMSPAIDSTAKSSSTVPTMVPSGEATTVNSALSGIAPPLVMAARRAPRRARTRPLMRSRWRKAPKRPRRAEMPSESMSRIASKSSRARLR